MMHVYHNKLAVYQMTNLIFGKKSVCTSNSSAHEQKWEMSQNNSDILFCDPQFWSHLRQENTVSVLRAQNKRCTSLTHLGFNTAVSCAERCSSVIAKHQRRERQRQRERCLFFFPGVAQSQPAALGRMIHVSLSGQSESLTGTI